MTLSWQLMYCNGKYLPVNKRNAIWNSGYWNTTAYKNCTLSLLIREIFQVINRNTSYNVMIRPCIYSAFVKSLTILRCEYDLSDDLPQFSRHVRSRLKLLNCSAYLHFNSILRFNSWTHVSSTGPLLRANPSLCIEQRMVSEAEPQKNVPLMTLRRALENRILLFARGTDDCLNVTKRFISLYQFICTAYDPKTGAPLPMKCDQSRK